MHGWILLFLLQDGHEICFVGDEAFRQLSKVDAEADKLLDQVQHWQYMYVSTVNAFAYTSYIYVYAYVYVTVTRMSLRNYITGTFC